MKTAKPIYGTGFIYHLHKSANTQVHRSSLPSNIYFLHVYAVWINAQVKLDAII